MEMRGVIPVVRAGWEVLEARSSPRANTWNLQKVWIAAPSDVAIRHTRRHESFPMEQGFLVEKRSSTSLRSTIGR